MCKCTPGIRTPYCGKIGCEWPKTDPEKIILDNEAKALLLEYREENVLKSLRGDSLAEALVKRIEEVLNRYK